MFIAIDLGQHDIPGMTLNQRRDLAVPGAEGQIAVPVTRHRLFKEGCRRG